MYQAIIDLGSNTIRLVVYEITGERFTAVLNKKEIAGAIGYINSGIMVAEGIDRIADVLDEMVSSAKRLAGDKVLCFATAPLRNIDNDTEVINAIKQRAGIAVDILSGEDEARYDFIGMLEAVSLDEGIGIDVGGGSTELIFFKNRKLEQGVSIPIGCLQLYNGFVQGIVPSDGERVYIQTAIAQALDHIDWVGRGEILTICAIGGTARAMAKLHKNTHLLTGNSQRYAFPAEDTDKMLTGIYALKEVAAKHLSYVIPDRVNTIVPGMMVYNTIAQKIKAKEIIISRFGVREGYLIENVIRKGIQ